MRHRLHYFLGWIIAIFAVLWRRSCRYDVVNDPRPQLRDNKQNYIYAVLHAHQIAAVFSNDEVQQCAMVSRSIDGDLLVPTLQCCRIKAVRGSSRTSKRDKGGLAALAQLTQTLRHGIPATLAVDGPRGPRNRVHLGIIQLAKRANAVILPVAVLSSRRWILQRTWDKMQIPKPLSKISLIFAPPIHIRHDISTADYQQKISQILINLEKENEVSHIA